MARIKLSLPDQFIFETKIPVRITDVNYGGHVGNDSILTIMHEARMQFLHSFGMSEKNFWEAGLIMGDVAIEFKKEAFYGDIIQVYMTVTDLERVSFDFIYKLETERDGKTIPVAFAKTGMVCFDYTAKKVSSIPEKAKLAFNI